MRRYRTILLLIAVLGSLTKPACAASTGPYTLQNAYDAALGAFEAVKISEEDVIQADSRVDQALTYLYPRITASGAYTKYNDVLPPGGGAFIFQPKDQVQASVVLIQPLYTGGRTLAALRVARSMQQSSRSGLTTERQNIMLRVAEAFYGVISAQKVVDASRDSLERMERHRKVTAREAATRRNKANASALLRANSLVSQSQILLLRSEDGLKIARRKLGLLTRLPENAVYVDPDILPPVEIHLKDLEELALSRRQELASARLNAQIAKEYVTITKGAHYPQIFAEGGVRYQDSDPQTGMDATTYYGGIRIQIPLFEGGLMSAEVAEARSKMRQAEYASALLERTVRTEVQEAYVNYLSLAAVLQKAQEQYTYSRSNFDTIEELFSDGLVPSLSLIDAQQALFLAEQQLIDARYAHQLSIVKLEWALGTLGRGPEESSPVPQ